VSCAHKRVIKLRPAQGSKTPHAFEWCEDCGALHAWDPERFNPRRIDVKGANAGWIIPGRTSDEEQDQAAG